MCHTEKDVKKQCFICSHKLLCIEKQNIVSQNQKWLFPPIPASCLEQAHSFRKPKEISHRKYWCLKIQLIFCIFNLISWSEGNYVGKPTHISACYTFTWSNSVNIDIEYAQPPTWFWTLYNSWANVIDALVWASLQRLQQQQPVNNSGSKQRRAWNWVKLSEATLWKQPKAQQHFYNLPDKLLPVETVLCNF